MFSLPETFNITHHPNSLSHLVRHLAALRGRRRSNADPKVHLRTLPVVAKLLNPDRLRVQYVNPLTADALVVPRQAGTLLRHRWFKVLRNVHVGKVVLRVQVVDRQPLDLGDFLVVRQTQRKVLVEIPLQDVCLTELIWHDEALRPGPIASAGPEKGVHTVAVVVEPGQQEGVLVDGVHVTRGLVVVRVELADVFTPVRAILRLLGDWGKLKFVLVLLLVQFISNSNFISVKIKLLNP